MIAAIDKKRGIGYKGKIPWHIKEDLLRFKNLTMGKTIIIGRKTYESLIGYYQRSGRPMPERKTIVVSNQKRTTSSKNTFWVNSIEKALELAKKIEAEEVFISGGAQIFNQGIKYAEKLYLTVVQGKFQTDTFFPNYSDFKIVKEENHQDNKQLYKFKFIEYIR